MEQELKLYSIPYGNGHNGSRQNIGRKLILAPNISEAKKCLSCTEGVKLGHIGAAKRIYFLMA